jgi:diamine N-acetyltransferase
MFVPVSTDDQIAMVVALAREIWTEHYTPIIGREQVEYMLDRFQSERAVRDQIGSGFLYFLIEERGRFIGYAAVLPKADELFLGKFYLKISHRRKGYGRKAIEYLLSLAKARGLRKITLTVNKSNTNAIHAYERLGFRNLGPVVQDIGGGFVMDDYRMEKAV